MRFWPKLFRAFCGRTFSALGAALLLAAPAAAEPPRRDILVLNQSTPGLPFNTALASAISSTINADGKSPTSFYSESLDAIVFPVPSTKMTSSNSSRPNTVEDTSTS
jgi:hypothetical protein